MSQQSSSSPTAYPSLELGQFEYVRDFLDETLPVFPNGFVLDKLGIQARQQEVAAFIYDAQLPTPRTTSDPLEGETVVRVPTLGTVANWQFCTYITGEKITGAELALVFTSPTGDKVSTIEYRLTDGIYIPTQVRLVQTAEVAAQSISGTNKTIRRTEQYLLKEGTYCGDMPGIVYSVNSIDRLGPGHRYVIAGFDYWYGKSRYIVNSLVTYGSNSQSLNWSQKLPEYCEPYRYNVIEYIESVFAPDRK